jgi:hypothetical protein
MDVPDGPEFSSQRLGDAVRLSLGGHWTVDASAAIEARADGLLAESAGARRVVGAYPKTQRAYRDLRRRSRFSLSPRICRDRAAHRRDVSARRAVFGSHRQAERRDADARAFAIIAAPLGGARDAQDRVDWLRSRCCQQIPVRGRAA